MQDTSLLSLVEKLNSLSDKTYKQFNESLIPGTENTSIGVRIPQLRKIAKEICHDDWRQFLQVAQSSSIYEIIMLRGLVIATAPCDFQERLQLLADFIPEIHNWAVCDCVCSSLKSINKHMPETFAFLDNYLKSREEFQLRFAVVILMDYFMIPDYITRVLDILKEIHHDGYYVNMAIAWALSVSFVKFREQTLSLLTQRCLSPWVQNKTIQKCRESRRISSSDKTLLMQFKLQEDTP